MPGGPRRGSNFGALYFQLREIEIWCRAGLRLSPPFLIVPASKRDTSSDELDSIQRRDQESQTEPTKSRKNCSGDDFEASFSLRLFWGLNRR